MLKIKDEKWFIDLQLLVHVAARGMFFQLDHYGSLQSFLHNIHIESYITVKYRTNKY